MTSRRPDPDGEPSTPDERVVAARKALLEGVGAEIAASFPGITRLGGQVVAALYLADSPRSMDELSMELGRSKSNIFANLRGLEAAGIIERRRESGARHDSYTLRGKYPDVIIGAYLARLRRVVQDKRALSRRALGLLGDAQGDEANALRKRLDDLSRKYDLFAELMDRYVPNTDGPVDLERLIELIPEPVLRALTTAVKAAFDVADTIAATRDDIARRANRKR
ncbi:GbsR/MarR family transcriptional regulator [Polyangium jinanense]|uniref:MarR family transcriptional regulator n=1 Tax=Polyangium jinanense TaxID=2829994 RepID=A0A9X4AQU9_9BACT|nr:MarR family transcriptional regulator [Polyangium jinanense]MDC3954448.1 MarR family transcriptional regulator [Polyangium jinanense]MDC3980751.1 MarR family transcriptional regulator [Polyangium jinanense]